ncbi:hypothetical protein OsJ_27530 [Oryza sativa Japonica Group]|uniref:Uncharacterized protein n=1 Tax=Oryza sativa subsp. japonica TaxID=39947 RepID=Q6ZLE9_ORYSJ|nr:hypothetical protein OsJ_27530 [Oryza sativa Japonica Group]BAD08738.1 hypothetical protein [Oryza sativa Japonica Group]
MEVEGGGTGSFPRLKGMAPKEDGGLAMGVSEAPVATLKPLGWRRVTNKVDAGVKGGGGNDILHKHAHIGEERH